MQFKRWGGNLGFSNYSPANVRYSGFTQEVLPPPPPTGVPDGGQGIVLFGLSLATRGFGRFLRPAKGEALS